jgi:hypothetical protein
MWGGATALHLWRQQQSRRLCLRVLLPAARLTRSRNCPATNISATRQWCHCPEHTYALCPRRHTIAQSSFLVAISVWTRPRSCLMKTLVVDDQECVCSISVFWSHQL